jgi:hypothetical protein
MPRSALARLARPAGSPLISSRIQAALGAVATLATIGLSQGSAQAYVVNMGGVEYDVTAFVGTYAANMEKFSTATLMPWWGNMGLASTFQSEVGNNIDLPGYDPTMFAWFFYDNGYGEEGYYIQGYSTSGQVNNMGLVSRPYAVIVPRAAAPAPAPAPGPLPILGAAAAFSASRKLRRRMKVIKVVASTATVV